MLTSVSMAATTVPTSAALLLDCPLKIQDTLLTIPMIPSPMMMRVSNCRRSTRWVYLKLSMRQMMAMRKIRRPSTMAITTLDHPLLVRASDHIRTVCDIQSNLFLKSNFPSG
jgi:hypothetical protein